MLLKKSYLPNICKKKIGDFSLNIINKQTNKQIIIDAHYALHAISKKIIIH